VVRTRLKSVHRYLLHFEYEILRADDQALLAEGETTHLIVDDKFQRSSLPKKYIAAFTGQRAE
jgi:acyl-CoA thioesterase FadM